jgi:hypothetical protein
MYLLGREIIFSDFQIVSIFPDIMILGWRVENPRILDLEKLLPPK